MDTAPHIPVQGVMAQVPQASCEDADDELRVAQAGAVALEGGSSAAGEVVAPAESFSLRLGASQEG